METLVVTAVPTLRRAVRIELVLLAAVVVAVGVLVQLRPGRDASARTPTAARSVPRPPTLPPRDAVVEAREDGRLAVAVARGVHATTGARRR